MVQVFLIVKPEINWNEFLRSMNSALGRSISSEIDKQNHSLNEKAFLIALSEINHETSDYLTKHLSFGFIVMSTPNLFSFISEMTELKVLSSDTINPLIRIGLVSGNLKQWKDAIIDFSSEDASKTMRIFSNVCMSHFEKMNLGSVWTGYRKSGMKDDTFKLITRI